MGARLLIGGIAVLVDECQVAHIRQSAWYARRSTDRRRVYFYGRPGRWTTSLHRFLTGAKKGEVVDHINGDTLDNRLCNLRVVTHTENNRNSRRKPNSLGYIGIVFAPQTRRYYGRVKTGQKQHYTSSFFNPEDAARARDALVLRLHGSHVPLNFPGEIA